MPTQILDLNNELEILEKIKEIIESKATQKKKTSDIIKILFREFNFTLTFEFNDKLKSIITEMETSLSVLLFYDLKGKLERKKNDVGDKTKELLLEKFKNRFHPELSIQQISDGDMSLLRETIKIIVEKNRLEENGKKFEFNEEISDELLVLFALLFHQNKSIYFDKVIWEFLKTTTLLVSKSNPRLKKPSQELSINILQSLFRKKPLNSLSSYYKKIGTYYAAYYTSMGLKNNYEQRYYNAEVENKNLQIKIEELYIKIENQKHSILALGEEKNNLEEELNNCRESKRVELEKAEKRMVQNIKMEKSALYKNMKNNIDYCFSEIKETLNRDLSKLKQENINLILRQIEKTDRLLNNQME